MSVATYSKNRTLGVTGRWTGTCFPAALDQLTVGRGVQATTYETYTHLVTKTTGYTGQAKRLRNPLYYYMYERIAEDLGASYDELTFRRYKNRTTFRRGVTRLLEEGCRVTVDILTEGCKATSDGEVHTVGLKPLNPGEAHAIRLVSTWVPRALHGVITLDALFDHVAQPDCVPRQHFAFNHTNVLALPAQELPAA